MKQRIVMIATVITALLILLVSGSPGFAGPPTPDMSVMEQAAVGTLDITNKPNSSTPAFIRGYIPLSSIDVQARATSATIALAFADKYADVFGITNAYQELDVVQSNIDSLGMTHVTMQQVYHGVEVYNAGMKIHLDANGDAVVAISNDFVPNISLPDTTPQINATRAEEIAKMALPGGTLISTSKLVIYPQNGVAHLAWLVELRDDAIPARNVYVVSATEEKILDVIERLYDQQPTTSADGSKQSHLLHLQYATFDPIRDGVPVVPENLAVKRIAPNIPTPFIVQFSDTIRPEWRTELENLGATVESYLPDNAFLVQMSPDAATTAARLDNVRWVGDFQPAYKLSPRLNADTARVRIQLASGADAATVQAQLATLGIVAGGDGQILIASPTAAQLPAIAQLPDVLWIEPFSTPHVMNDKATSIMNVPIAWTLGYTGAGQIVTIADTGLDTGVDNYAVNGDIHLDFDNRVTHISSWPVQNHPSCYVNINANDGAADLDSGHGTHVTGSVAGNGARSSGTIRGAAYGADITFQAVEQYTVYTGTCASRHSNGYALSGIPGDIRDLFQEAYDWGSRIHTNSWGSDVAGAYTINSQNADDFIWHHPDFTVLFAAGNAGVDADHDGYVDEGSVGSPATAKNVITIGASDNVRSSGGYQGHWGDGGWGDPPVYYKTAPTSSDYISDSAEEMAAFSSRGPTADGRIKPDLVAPGTNILSTRSISATSTGWGAYNSYYMYDGGTSMATPLAAGAVAVVRDYLVNGAGIADPSAALIKAVLINSADDISGYGNAAEEAGQPIPNMHEGWGRINVAAAVNATNRTLYNNESLTNGGSHTYQFTVSDTVDALKVSLVWSDYPGSTGAAQQLVNNLNLVVIAPNGSATYLGNHFSNGWSTTGGSADTVNNVENVYVHNPISGAWTIRVVGANIPQGPQPFALVVNGASPSPRSTYSANNDTILPGQLMRVDNAPPTGDQDVDNAHDFAGATYEYYMNTFGRDSYDDQGATIISTAHYGNHYQNAFWNGSQMVYGDGIAVKDVVAHELTHAVTEHTANLEYNWQSGALNESFSDIFGAMVDRDDWLMGEDLPATMLAGRDALRDLSDPPRLGQPGHTDDWVQTCSDHEGVHTNSGITNKAYYNIATAIGKDKAEQIFYRTLTVYLTSSATLEEARASALQSAQDLYGSNSNEYAKVEEGFNAVGLDGRWNPPQNDCTCAARAAIADETVYPDQVSALEVVTTLYQVRSRLLSSSTAGEHYRDLYSQYTGKISLLLAQNSYLRQTGGQILKTVTPGLKQLMNGNGDANVVTREMVTEITAYLQDMADEARQNGDDDLAQTIEDEMARLDWDNIVGMTFTEAWDYIQAQIDTPIYQVYIPLIFK